MEPDPCPGRRGKNQRNDPFYSGSPAIFLKPAFRKPLFTRRCVVIADAFVGWSAAGKQPWLVYLRDRERPFGMAGLYDIWVHPVTKAEIPGFALITVPGNALFHKLPAHRMPVIIPRGRGNSLAARFLSPERHPGDAFHLSGRKNECLSPSPWFRPETTAFRERPEACRRKDLQRIGKENPACQALGP